MSNDADRALVERALTGAPAAVRDLIAAITPVVRARVARILMRRAAAARGRDVVQELDDLSQDVFVALFERQGRILKSWDPDAGLSLANFVGLVAERRTTSALRSRRQSPWTEDPTAPADLGSAVGTGGFEQAVGQRSLLQALLDRLRSELSPKGLMMFEMMMIEQRPVADICAATGMSSGAVYAWRSRLAKQARALRDSLLAEGATAGGAP